MRKGMVLSGVMSLMMVVLVASPVLAARWRLNLGVGYGTYSPPLIGKINEFIQDCNSWAENTFGLTDFGMEEMKLTGPLYTLNSRTEIGPFWEVGLDLNYWQAKEISLDKELTIPLEAGSETISVYGDFSARIAFADLVVYRKFVGKSKSKLAPFVGVGIGYYGANILGDYSIWDYTYIPPWDWEYRDVCEGFSVSDSSVGYVLTAGAVWTPVEHLRISLDAKYHCVPELTGEFEDTYCEGFSSLPMEPEPFKLDLSGLTAGITLMLRF